VALTCYFDCFSGIAGDMIVGALADAGADQQAVQAAIISLQIDANVSFEKVKRGGIAATHFQVQWPEQKSHRHLSGIVKIIERGALSDRARANALAIFRKLAEAEAAAHDVPIEKVHFHEVGAVDSISDIVAACVALDQLGVNEVYCSPVNTGSGTVNTEHGILPVPAPATARLLIGAPVYAQGPTMELTTPTGAAVAATLAKQFGPLPPMKIARTGHGAGTRDFPGQPNVLRVILGETTPADEALTVSVIEANIDDLNPQVLAWSAERLFEAGALDVTIEPIIMKKGRPGTLLRVIAKPEDREMLAQQIFAETSTLGIRVYSVERRVRARTFTEVETPYGKVRVKVSSEGDFAPEYEDCRLLAISSGVPLKQVIAEATYAYLNRTR
jgi:pyridinium-3,5-bisthiocarboxylic acid mononucleotide nickel chelatase